MPGIVEIDGHSVDADKVDLFYHGCDGSRITDAEWDESRDRTCNSLEELKCFGFDFVGTAGDEAPE